MATTRPTPSSPPLLALAPAAPATTGVAAAVVGALLVAHTADVVRTRLCARPRSPAVVDADGQASPPSASSPSIALARRALRAEWMRATAWASVLVVWPVAWLRLGGAQGGAQGGAVRLGLLWPYAMMLAEVLSWVPRAEEPLGGGGGGGGGNGGDGKRVAAAVAAAAASGVPALRVDPGALMSVTFAMAGIVGAARDAPRLRFFVAGAVVLLALALPQPTLAASGETRVAVEAAQSALVACAMGLVLSGALHGGSGSETGVAIDGRTARAAASD